MGLIPKITPSELEKILEYLPRPDVQVALIHSEREYSLSPLFEKMKQNFPFLPGSDFFPELKKIVFEFSEMEKSAVLALYSQYYLSRQQLEGTVPGYDHKKSVLEVEAIRCDFSRNDLRTYKISEEEYVSVMITDEKVNLHYHGEEPEVITKIRRSLEWTKAKINLSL